jgi:hypothetical protein
VADRVARFVADGGALLIFPGPGIDTRNYNEVLFPALGLPPAVLADPSAGTGRGDSLQDGMIRFDRVDYAHPVFDGLFDAPLTIREDGREIESPSILQAFAARVSGTGRTIIALSNGQSFLSAYRLGGGTILAFAVDPGLGWSDFAVKGVFVPLLHRSVLSAFTSVPRVGGVTAGEPIEITLRQGRSSPTGVYVLLTPGGREERLVPRILPGGGLRFASQPTTEVGNHLLLRTPGPEGPPGAPLITVPVNLAARESDLATAGDDEVEEFWKRSGLDPGRAVTLRSPSDIGASIREARVGVELWRHALVMALLCALLEMLIGRAPKPRGAGG